MTPLSNVTFENSAINHGQMERPYKSMRSDQIKLSRLLHFQGSRKRVSAADLGSSDGMADSVNGVGF